MLLYPIWLIFAALFFTFAFQHWRLAQRPVRPFRLREGDFEGEAGRVIKSFVEDWNRYLEDVNQNNGDKHRIAMIGYIVAGALAVFSMVLLLIR